MVEQLARQVLEDGAIVATELTHRAVRIGARASAQRGQIEPGRPALGTLVQRFEDIGVESHARRLEQQARLGR
jgi:hypothetical protein